MGMAMQDDKLVSQQRSASVKPVSSFPKQAIVVIHGMGEQRPMDTIKGFVRSVWTTDTIITANRLPNPAEAWSKPDLRTGSSLDDPLLTAGDQHGGCQVPPRLQDGVPDGSDG